MTDNDIIKALECCCKNNNCEGCPLDYFDFSSQCASELAIKSLDLINRQQAENERLEKENTVFGEIIKKQDDEISALRKDLLKRENLEESYSKSVKQFDKRLEKTVKLERAEAVKECLAKVKNYIKTHCNPYGKPDFDYDTSIKILNFIDKLKEMVGENNEY